MKNNEIALIVCSSMFSLFLIYLLNVYNVYAKYTEVLQLMYNKNCKKKKLLIILKNKIYLSTATKKEGSELNVMISIRHYCNIIVMVFFFSVWFINAVNDLILQLISTSTVSFD